MFCLISVPLLLAGFTLPDSVSSDRIPDSHTTGLKFGLTAQDYVLFKPAIEPLEESFSICGWIKKLKSDSPYQTWFAYGAAATYHDILILDNGYYRIFDLLYDLRSKVKPTLGEWKHSCVTWALSSHSFKVFFEGELIGSKVTPSGKMLIQFLLSVDTRHIQLEQSL